jgi:hypothetical protein
MSDIIISRESLPCLSEIAENSKPLQGRPERARGRKGERNVKKSVTIRVKFAAGPLASGESQYEAKDGRVFGLG